MFLSSSVCQVICHELCKNTVSSLHLQFYKEKHTYVMYACLSVWLTSFSCMDIPETSHEYIPLETTLNAYILTM